MGKFLLLLVIAGDPQIIKPMDSAADCIVAAELLSTLHNKMLWCGRYGGCSGKDVQVTCWNPAENKALEIPTDKK